MPIYEYECAKCEKVIEMMQKFSDAPLAACPDCNSPVKKLVSMSSFALKGTGWYTTDYKKSGGPKPVTAPATESKSADSASTATPAAAPAVSAPAPAAAATTSTTKSGS